MVKDSANFRKLIWIFNLFLLVLVLIILKYVFLKNILFLDLLDTNKDKMLVNFVKFANDRYCSNGAEKLKLIAQNVRLEKNNDYIIYFYVEKLTGPLNLHIDLYGGPKYDSPKQEKTLYLTRANRDFYIHLNSGSYAPNLAQARVFFRSKHNVCLSNITIYKLNKFGQFCRRSIDFLIIVVSLIVLCLLYKINKIIFHACLFVLFLVFLFYFACKIGCFGSGDTYSNVPVSLSILSEGNLDLDEFQEAIPVCWKYAEIQVGSHWYLNFPIGEPILITPIVFIFRFFLGLDLLRLEVFSAFFIYSLLSFLFFILVFILTSRLSFSYLLSFIFACCTTNATTISTGLWTHGGLELMLIVALLLILIGEKRNISYFLVVSSIPLALAYIVRPTASIFIIFLSLYVFMQHRNIFIPFSLLMISIFACFILISIINYNSLLPPYYLASRLSLKKFWEALIGQSFSPNRGFFIWQPVFLFSVYGLIYYFKNGPMLIKFLNSSVCCFFIILATFPHWWGGCCYGPRLFTDITPIMVILLIPCLKKFLNFKDTLKGKIFIVLFLLSLLLSALVQFRGLTNWNVHLWNATPISVDKAPQRIWNWHDIQFLRGLN